MQLVIVESPTKGNTIKRFLGPEYRVLSSYGHVRDLPEDEFGVDVENDFKPKYIIPKKSKKIIQFLKEAAKKADLAIIATDEDREGESIAWHLTQILNLNGQKSYQRIVFHEITKSAIDQALKNPRKIDLNLVDAQQARRILDRIVGYKLSPFLWKKVARGLSAGRVQSVAVRLVVEREREIENFVPQEYWTIVASLQKSEKEFEALLTKKSGKTIPKLGIKNKKEAEKIVKDLKGAEYKVINIEKKEVKRNPLPPFTTSTLQQEAWKRFHWPARFTMNVAQNLYERGICVDENSLVITSAGEIYKIKDLEKLNKNLVGLDEKSLKPDFAKVNKFWKIRAPKKMISVETDSHEKILITKDHPLMILRNGRPVWVEGKNIKTGDYVGALETIPVARRKSPSHLVELIKYLPKTAQGKVVFKFSPPFFSFIRRRKKKETVPYHVIERLWREKRMPMDKIEKYYRGVKVKPMVGDSRFHQIPFYLSPEISYLVGLVASDGHLDPQKPKINVAHKSEFKSVLKELNKLLEKVLGVEFNRFTPQRKQIPINSTFLYHLLPQFGIPTGNKANRIDISNLLLSQPDEILKAYIAGLWDGDGCIAKSWKNSLRLSYSSKSEIFIDKLRLLLKTFGMNSAKHFDKRNDVFWLLLTANAIPKFRDNVAPYLIIKKERWKNLYQAYRQLYEKRTISRCQQIPEINSLLENLLIKGGLPKQKLSKLIGVDLFNYFGKAKKYHTRPSFIQKSVLKDISKYIDDKDKLFAKLSQSPIIWKEVTSIKNISYKKPYVYDVTTPTNTFIVNGLVSHNCTYHRTDSLNLSDQSLFLAKKFITASFGKEYWAGFLRRYKAKGRAQEAHEAIRPTYPARAPESVKLGQNQLKLYDLIWRRFIACQMSQAIFDSTLVDIAAKNYIFRATGQAMKFDGFLKVYPMKFEETELPPLEKDDILELIKLKPSQHFTQPKPRYTEATLIKALEENGIGRPSTYAPILSTIQERNYIEKNGEKRFQPTEIGIVVNDLLVNHFPKIVDIKFTAGMEEDLDEIAEGQRKWVEVLKEFYQPFEENLKQKYQEVSKKDVTEKPTEKICPKCGAPLLIRLGKFGKFYACSKFPKCKYTEPLEENILGIKCPKCKKGEIVEKRTRKRKIFYGCNRFPKCDFALWDKPTGEKCPKCGALLIETKRKQIKCSNKECDFKK